MRENGNGSFWNSSLWFLTSLQDIHIVIPEGPSFPALCFTFQSFASVFHLNYSLFITQLSSLLHCPSTQSHSSSLSPIIFLSYSSRASRSSCRSLSSLLFILLFKKSSFPTFPFSLVLAGCREDKSGPQIWAIWSWWFRHAIYFCHPRRRDEKIRMRIGSYDFSSDRIGEFGQIISQNYTRWPPSQALHHHFRLSLFSFRFVQPQTGVFTC